MLFINNTHSRSLLFSFDSIIFFNTKIHAWNISKTFLILKNINIPHFFYIVFLFNNQLSSIWHIIKFPLSLYVIDITFFFAVYKNEFCCKLFLLKHFYTVLSVCDIHKWTFSCLVPLQISVRDVKTKQSFVKTFFNLFSYILILGA